MLLIGTYTEKVSDEIVGKGEGIYFLSWDSQEGNANLKGHIPAVNVSYMAFAPTYQCLYTLEELPHARLPKLSVYKYNIKNEQTEYTLIDRQDINGGSPCHMDITENNNELAIACYTTGNAEIYSIDDLGKTKHIQSVTHIGQGPNRSRQESAHMHMALYQNEKLYLADLGTDSIKAYKKKGEKYVEAPEGEMKTVPGSGARHFVFHPSGNFAYVLGELTSEVFVFAKVGSGFKRIQTVELLPDSFKGMPSAAAIRIAKNGNYIYVSERTTSLITVLKTNPANGTLQIIQQLSSGGKTPRDININPTGNWLVVPNQDSDNIAIFRIDKDKGTVTIVRSIQNIRTPACLIWHED